MQSRRFAVPPILVGLTAPALKRPPAKPLRADRRQVRASASGKLRRRANQLRLWLRRVWGLDARDFRAAAS